MLKEIIDFFKKKDLQITSEKNKEIDIIWDKIYNNEYQNPDEFLKELDEINQSFETYNEKDSEIKFHMVSRLLVLYKMYYFIKEVPNGMSVCSSILSNKDRENIGFLFHKEAVKVFKEKVEWSVPLFNNAELIDEVNKEYIVLHSPENMSNLFIICNMAIDLDTNEILYERNYADSLTKEAYFEYIKKI